MKVGTPVNDYQTMLERLIAAAERPKPGASVKENEFWRGQAMAYKTALNKLHKFKDKVFPLSDSEKDQ